MKTQQQIDAAKETIDLGMKAILCKKGMSAADHEMARMHAAMNWALDWVTDGGRAAEFERFLFTCNARMVELGIK